MEKSEMQKKTQELYQEYLEKRLGLIFDITSTNDKEERVDTNLHDDVNIYPKVIAIGSLFIVEGYEFNYKTDKGELLSPNLWFDDAYDFHEGYAMVYIKGKGYNYIDTQGQLIWPNLWFDEAENFHEGYAKVQRLGEYNYIDTKGRILSPDLWFGKAEYFHEGYAVVWIERKGYNYIDTQGKMLSLDLWFDTAKKFHEGYAVVCTEGKGYNYVDTQGKILSPDLWFDDAYDFHEGYAVVYIKRKGYNYIDTKGKLLSSKWFPSMDFKVVNDTFIDISNHYVCVKKNMGDYQVKKGLINYRYIEDKKPKVGIKRGYKCQNDKDKFNVLYEPIRIYGIRFVLCLNNDKVILYDREGLTYQTLGTVNDIKFNDNLIINKTDRKVYLMYDKKMIDISEYYYSHELDKKWFNINQGISVLSKEDFFYKNEEEIRKLIRQTIDEEEARKQEEAKEKELQKLQELQAKETKEQEENQEAEREALIRFRDVLKQIEKLRKNGNINAKIEVPDDFFISVGYHEEINPLYIENGLLKLIDLRFEDFENVKVDGIDFRGCSNIGLNPQLIYEKSLKNCNFEGIYIGMLMDFTEVDIRGCKFSDDNDPKTIDRKNIHFGDAIYDETTTYNGEPFTKIFGECKHKPRKK